MARDILSAFVRTSDGYRARAGIVQVNRWRAALGLPPADPKTRASPPLTGSCRTPRWPVGLAGRSAVCHTVTL